MTDWREERSHQAAALIPRGDSAQGGFKAGVVNTVRSREMRDRPMSEIVEVVTAAVHRQVPGFVPVYPTELLDV